MCKSVCSTCYEEEPHNWRSIVRTLEKRHKVSGTGFGDERWIMYAVNMPVFHKDVRYNGQQQQKYYWLGRMTCVSIVHRAYGIYTIWGSCLQYALKQQKLQFLCWTMCSASWVLSDEYCMVLLYVRKCAFSMKTWDTMLNVVWYCRSITHTQRSKWMGYKSRSLSITITQRSVRMCQCQWDIIYVTFSTNLKRMA